MIMKYNIQMSIFFIEIEYSNEYISEEKRKSNHIIF